MPSSSLYPKRQALEGNRGTKVPREPSEPAQEGLCRVELAAVEGRLEEAQQGVAVGEGWGRPVSATVTCAMSSIEGLSGRNQATCSPCTP